jgi:hypothetical protein
METQGSDGFKPIFTVFLLLVCLMMTISQVPLGVLTVVRFYNLDTDGLCSG